MSRKYVLFLFCPHEVSFLGMGTVAGVCVCVCVGWGVGGGGGGGGEWWW